MDVNITAVIFSQIDAYMENWKPDHRQANSKRTREIELYIITILFKVKYPFYLLSYLSI